MRVSEVEALKVLRDRRTGTAAFRSASHCISLNVSEKTAALLKEHGERMEKVTLVVILRAAVALLEPAIRIFPGAPVGVLGLKRDEKTLEPHWYYENVPRLSKRGAVVILDPMLATGGSAEAAVIRLVERGADARKVYFTGIVGAPEGLARLSGLIPRGNIVLAALDAGLDAHAMIVPGLGDFGDRYFGHEGHAVLRNVQTGSSDLRSRTRGIP